ncbi:hypothetical protein V6N13_041004 [Hibiscus sabdariffa]
MSGLPARSLWLCTQEPADIYVIRSVFRFPANLYPCLTESVYNTLSRAVEEDRNDRAMLSKQMVRWYTLVWNRHKTTFLPTGRNRPVSSMFLVQVECLERSEVSTAVVHPEIFFAENGDL